MFRSFTSVRTSVPVKYTIVLSMYNNYTLRHIHAVASSRGPTPAARRPQAHGPAASAISQPSSRPA